MISASVKEMLSKRKDRAIATILSYKDLEVDPHIPQEIRVQLRKVVLDQLNDLYDFSLDLIRSVESGEVTINEEYVERLNAALDRVEGLVDGN